MAGTNGKNGIKKVIMDIVWGFSAELVWATGLLLLLALICAFAWFAVGR